MARPELKEGQQKSKILGIRFKPEERALIDSAAAAQGEKPSEWARKLLIRAARRGKC